MKEEKTTPLEVEIIVKGIDPNKVYTPLQAGELLGRGRQAIYQARYDGQINSLDMGVSSRTILFQGSELIRYIEERIQHFLRT